MANLWKSRTPPIPIKWGSFNELSGGSTDATTTSTTSPQTGAVTSRDQKIWTLAECADVLAESVTGIKVEFAKLAENDHLVWDKDDKHAMDFVAACANIRSIVFGIAQKSRFEIKCKRMVGL